MNVAEFVFVEERLPWYFWSFTYKITVHKLQSVRCLLATINLRNAKFIITNLLLICLGRTFVIMVCPIHHIQTKKIFDQYWCFFLSVLDLVVFCFIWSDTIYNAVYEPIIVSPVCPNSESYVRMTCILQNLDYQLGVNPSPRAQMSYGPRFSVLKLEIIPILIRHMTIELLVHRYYAILHDDTLIDHCQTAIHSYHISLVTQMC